MASRAGTETTAVCVNPRDTIIDSRQHDRFTDSRFNGVFGSIVIYEKYIDH